MYSRTFTHAAFLNCHLINCYWTKLQLMKSKSKGLVYCNHIYLPGIMPLFQGVIQYMKAQNWKTFSNRSFHFKSVVIWHYNTDKKSVTSYWIASCSTLVVRNAGYFNSLIFDSQIEQHWIVNRSLPLMIFFLNLRKEQKTIMRNTANVLKCGYPNSLTFSFNKENLTITVCLYFELWIYSFYLILFIWIFPL